MAEVRRCRVVMDVGPAVHQGAGLSKYAERLAVHLRRHASDRVDLSLFYNAHSGHTLPPSLADLPAKSLSMGQIAWRLRVLASQLLGRPRLTHLLPPGWDDPTQPPLLFHAVEHLLPRLPCPTVMTVHDLIFEHYPAHHTRRNRLFLKLAMPAFVRAAAAIIAVSRQTQADLMAVYQVPAEKITVIHEGIDDTYVRAQRGAIEAVRQRHGLTRPYLIMVGTLEPRKNHVTALRALARLKAWGWPHQLVIVGGQGWLFDPIRQQVTALGLDDDVLFTGYAPQADLSPLYSGAACTLMPSLYEGFGFPVLESMACGTPVVSSDASSLPEVAGQAALLAPPTDDAAWAEQIRRVLAEDALATDLRQRGLARAAQFRWDDCARRTADLYLALAQRSSA